MSETIQRTVVKFTLVKIFAFVLLVCFSTNSVLAVVCLCTSPLFSTFSEYSAGSEVDEIETGDFNKDLKLDLIVINKNTNSVSILLGNGSGGFSAQPPISLVDPFNPQNPINPQDVVVADFDEDSKLDFATSNSASNNITVGYNQTPTNGSLAFEIKRYTAFDNPSISVNPKKLTVVDFNDDGKLDIATCNDDNNNTVSVFEYVGARAFSKRTNYVLSSAYDLHSISTADFNNDGWADIVATGLGSGDTIKIYVMLNGKMPDASGTGWIWSVDRPQNANGSQIINHFVIYRSITGDFDNDGKTDDLIAADGEGFIYVFLGNNSGKLIFDHSIGIANYFGGGLSAGDFNLDGKLDFAAAGHAKLYNPSTLVHFALKLDNGQFGNVTSVNLNLGHIPTTTAVGDFNGDGRSDVASSVATANTAAVFLNTHNENAISKTDYNRNGGTDYAVWRPSVGDWYIANSFFPNDPNKQINYHFGAYGDIPVQGDYDGDKKTDFAVFRLNNNTWYILHSSSNGPFISQLWGASNDKLVPGDYDGDCKTDIAIYRPSLGLWCIIKSSNGSQQYTQFGANDDIPVQGDYDHDGKTDLAVFRPSNNTWYIQRSTAGFLAQQWGATADKPVPGDYDGDCKTDIAVFRPSTGGWHIIKSSGGFLNYQVGTSTDTPQQGDYDGDGKTDAAIWRSTTGDWWVLKSSHFNVYPFNLSTPPPPTVQNWGANGDIPTASIYPVQ